MRSHWLVWGRFERVFRAASTVFGHPSASATSEKFSSAVFRVLTSTQNMPQNLVQSAQHERLCIRNCARDSPVSNFICHVKTYLALTLTTHTSQDKPSLFIPRILESDSFDNLVNDFAPASEVRVSGTVHKPMLISYTTKWKFSQRTTMNQYLLELIIPHEFKKTN